MTDSERFSAAWRVFRATTDLDEYDTRWDRLAAEGHDVHGEAEFVMGYEPARVLDAGCGMGRVAIELDRRGVAVVGVDLDPDLLARAERRAPHLRWVQADLADLDGHDLAGPERDGTFHAGSFDAGRFDAVVMAGNVLPFAEPDRRADVVATLARQLRPGGRLISGATLTEGWPTVDDLDGWSTRAGLDLEARYGGWAREAFDPASAGYVVAVYRRLSRRR